MTFREGVWFQLGVALGLLAGPAVGWGGNVGIFAFAAASVVNTAILCGRLVWGAGAGGRP